MERVKGIEPSSSGWKPEALPLSYTRIGGGGWIRTNVDISQQFYRLPPLTTRPPLLFLNTKK